MLTFSNKDGRLLDSQKKEAALKNRKNLQTTHQHIAYDLGSSREVVSRLLKKLESEDILKLGQNNSALL